MYFQRLDQTLVIQIILAFQRGKSSWHDKKPRCSRAVFVFADGPNPISPGPGYWNGTWKPVVLPPAGGGWFTLRWGELTWQWNFYHLDRCISYWNNVDFHGYVSLPESIQNIPRLLKMPRNPWDNPFFPLGKVGQNSPEATLTEDCFREIDDNQRISLKILVP